MAIVPVVYVWNELGAHVLPGTIPQRIRAQ